MIQVQYQTRIGGMYQNSMTGNYEYRDPQYFVGSPLAYSQGISNELWCITCGPCCDKNWQEQNKTDMKKYALVVLPIFLTAGQFALIPLHNNSLDIAIGAVVTVIETAYLSTMCFYCRREADCTCNDKYWTVLVASAAGCTVLSAMILFFSSMGMLYGNN